MDSKNYLDSNKFDGQHFLFKNEYEEMYFLCSILTKRQISQYSVHISIVCTHIVTMLNIIHIMRRKIYEEEI